jgi:glycogen debranching enzyme
MPVEIQGLWYNALRTMEDLSIKLGKPAEAEQFRKMATRAQSAFEPLFWNPETNCLYDVVNGRDLDGAIRPNQLFALSLTYPLLRGERALQVVDRVERDLLTPYGLRSLAPNDPRYMGRCEGNPQLRDAAYHQGTVWSWLLGPFLTAYVRVHDHTPAALARAYTWLESMKMHLSDAGLDQISEIFDGDPPHHPRGCIAQAWSVGETLRILGDLRESTKNC